MCMNTQHHHHCHEEHDHHEHHHHHGEECGCGHGHHHEHHHEHEHHHDGECGVAADTIMTMNIITIIMQMKCLQAGDESDQNLQQGRNQQNLKDAGRG